MPQKSPIMLLYFNILQYTSVIFNLYKQYSFCHWLRLFFCLVFAMLRPFLGLGGDGMTLLEVDTELTSLKPRMRESI